VSSAHTQQIKGQKEKARTQPKAGPAKGQTKKGLRWPGKKTRKENESCANWANEINKFR